MSNNAHSETGDGCPKLWPAAYSGDHEIVTLSGNAQDVAAYAAAIAVAQAQYPGHFGHNQFTHEKADDLLNFPDTTTYAIRDMAGGVLGAITVLMIAGNARFEYLFRLKVARDGAYGKLLLLQGLRHAELQGAKRVELDVVAHNPAQQLYEAVGFEPYDEDLLDMDGGRYNDVISMRVCGEQAISCAQARLEAIIEQQLHPELQQQSA